MTVTVTARVREAEFVQVASTATGSLCAQMMTSAVIAPVRVGLMMPSVAVSTTRVQHRLCARSLGADVRRAQPAVESHKREAEVGNVMSASAKAAGLWYLAIAVVGSIAHTLGALVIYGVSCFACFAYAWGTRPVGRWAQRPAEGDESSSLKVKTSAIPGAGLGLFAARDLQEGLVFGTLAFGCSARVGVQRTSCGQC